MEFLKELGTIPFTKSALMPILRNYKSPKDKISSLIKKGDIIPLKNGLYVVSEKYRTQKINLELLANQIYGPSYISLDSALSYYGVIPEKVNIVSSVCVKRSRKFENPIGRFYYYYAKPEYFRIGVSTESIDNSKSIIVASLEKALCDKIVFSRNLNIRSIRSIVAYLEDDLRIDFSGINVFKYQVIEQCIACGIKTKELKLLLRFIKTNF